MMEAAKAAYRAEGLDYDFLQLFACEGKKVRCLPLFALSDMVVTRWGGGVLSSCCCLS